MCSTNDGFIIAEEDLKLRGPGDIMGTQQSGVLELKMANLAVDGKILHVARQYAFNLLEEDPHLEKPVHQNLKITLNAMLKKKLQWTRIS
jgi:ATP-dependent DNA helicase RecG